MKRMGMRVLWNAASTFFTPTNASDHVLNIILTKSLAGAQAQST